MYEDGTQSAVRYFLESSETLDADQLEQRLRKVILRKRRLHRTPQVPMIEIASDMSVPIAGNLVEYLQVARRAGIEELRLHGRSTARGELETAGAWTRPVGCLLGYARFDDDGRPLEEFASWSELAMAAHALAPEPLLLRP